MQVRAFDGDVTTCLDSTADHSAFVALFGALRGIARECMRCLIDAPSLSRAAADMAAGMRLLDTMDPAGTQYPPPPPHVQPCHCPVTLGGVDECDPFL